MSGRRRAGSGSTWLRRRPPAEASRGGSLTTSSGGAAHSSTTTGSRISSPSWRCTGCGQRVRYDPERLQRSYGRDGGDPFASWIADILCHRVTDWYRSKAEGGGDSRYNNHCRIELVGTAIEDEDDPDAAFERELVLVDLERWPDLA